MILCNKCCEQLVFLQNDLRCPKCHKVWNEIILENEEYVDRSICREFNSLISFEYHKLIQFIENKQVYGGILQLKDLYEVLIKFPVLVGASYLFHTKIDDEKTNEFLLTLINQKNSMGNWHEHLSKLVKLLKGQDEIRPLYIICRKIFQFIEENGVINWRNKNIGHGATKQWNDDHLYEDLFSRFKQLTSFLNEEKENFLEIKIIIETKDCDVELIGHENVFVKEKGKLKVKINSMKVELDPFFYVIDDGLYFYDNYFSKKSYLDIIEYPRGKRDIRLTHVFDNLKLDDQNSSSIESESIQKAEIDISNKVLNIADFVEPKYIYEWIEDNIDDENKIMLLQCERGMGKSTLVRALDPFQMNKKKLFNTSIRAYYINPTYGSKIYGFCQSVYTSIIKDDEGCEYQGNFYYMNKDSINPKEELAKLLNQAKKQDLYKNRNLLFILDGLDEINPNQNGLNIADFIPDKDMLDDGVYILLTARTFLDRDEITPFTKKLLSSLNEKVEHLVCQKEDTKFIELKKKYLLDQIIKPLQDFCTRKNVKAIIDSESINSISEDIQDNNFLYLRQLKELSFIKAGALLDQGCQSIDISQIILSKKNELLDDYFESLKSNYGEKYYRQFARIMAAFALIDDDLTMEDLSYLINNGNMTLSFLGFINNIRMFLSVKRTILGNSFTISHQDIFQYIKDKMSNIILELADEILAKIRLIRIDHQIDYYDKFDMVFMPYLINIARTYHRLNEDKKYHECLSIIDEVFRTQKRFDVGDMMNDMMITRNIKLQESILIYAQKHVDLNNEEDKLHLAKTLLILAGFRFSQRDSQNCISDYQKANELLSSMNLKDDDIYKLIIAEDPYIIYLYAERKDFDQILVFNEWYMKYFNRLKENNYPLSLYAQTNPQRIMYYYYQMTNQYQYTIELQEEELEILSNYKTQREKWDYVTALSSYGKSLSNLHIFDKALKALFDSEKYFEEMLKDGYVLYGKNIWYNFRRITDTYIRLKDYVNAEIYAQKAIECLENLEKTNRLSNRVFPVQALYDLHKVYFEQKDYEKCKSVLEKALVRFEELDKFQQNKQSGINVHKLIVDRLKLINELEDK